MTPRAELIYDHEIDISDDPASVPVISRLGASIRGYEQDGTCLWIAQVEWLGQGDAIALVRAARGYAYGADSKPILTGQRIHLIWA